MSYSIENIREFWDDCHINKKKENLTGAKYDDIINYLKIKNYINPQISVLEIGPGLGYVVEGFFERGIEISVIDISIIAIDRLKKYCKYSYVVEQLEELPIDYFDIIICSSVIQHIPTSELIIELKHIVNSLKPNTGIFALQFVSDNTLTEDTGIDPSLDRIMAGGCCRNPEYLKKIINNLDCVCDEIDTIPVPNNATVSCAHIFHVRKLR